MAFQGGHDPVLGKHGLALLRLVISSYFIAISLGVIPGVNPGLVFETWFDAAQAKFIGDSLMAGCSIFVFMGLFLRISCLYLALLVLSSTVMENILLSGLHAPEALWRDIVFVSALLLIYGSMSRQSLLRVALVKRARKIRKVHVNGDRVVPRRVASAKPAAAEPATGQNPLPAISFPGLRAKSESRFQEDIGKIFKDADAKRGAVAS